MQETPQNGRYILITGGTSGLGLELVKLFHDIGFNVICTGRQPKNVPDYGTGFQFINVDFKDLANTAGKIYEICKMTNLRFIICNAGILSPPEFSLTGDGYEYTFQVNFLAHLLINEIIIKNNPDKNPLKIVAVTSPVYKMAKSFPGWECDIKNYRPLKSYTDSKLFLAMMGNHLTVKYPKKNISCFSIDPGVFSSSIYRNQRRFFRFLYGVASPFMRNPLKVANAIYEMMIKPDFSGGAIYNIRKKQEHLPEFDQTITGSFWEKCDEIAGKYI